MILPHDWSEVVKNASTTTLSFQECFFDLALGDYTGITSMDAHLIKLLRQDLVHLLDRTQPTLAGVVSTSTDYEIGLCEGIRIVDLLSLSYDVNDFCRVDYGHPTPPNSPGDK